MSGVVWTLSWLILGAILITYLVNRRPSESFISHFDVIFLEDLRGRGSGTPYLVELELTRDGYPVVVHIDIDGLPSILFPFETALRVRAGQRIRLPDADGSVTWWTASGEQAGSLLLAVGRSVPESNERLLELAERAATHAPSARAARENVRRVLRDRLGPAVLAELSPSR